MPYLLSKLRMYNAAKLQNIRIKMLRMNEQRCTLIDYKDITEDQWLIRTSIQCTLSITLWEVRPWLINRWLEFPLVLTCHIIVWVELHLLYVIIRGCKWIVERVFMMYGQILVSFYGLFMVSKHHTHQLECMWNLTYTFQDSVMHHCKI